jgi:hypothetical protein
MKKSELILAQKALAARQTKLESKVGELALHFTLFVNLIFFSQVIRQELKALRESYSGNALETARQGSSQQQSNRGTASRQQDSSLYSNNVSSEFGDSLTRAATLPEIKQAHSPLKKKEVC